MKTNTHTPTPLIGTFNAENPDWICAERNGFHIACIKKEHANFIIRAVNLHETYAKTINEIKEQLMYADDRMAMLEAIEKAVNKAIAKAEEK